MGKNFLALVFLVGVSSSVVFAKRADSARGIAPVVDFVNLKDGDSVKSPFKVKMAVNGMKVRPAGEDAEDKTSGHHHLIIDGTSVPSGQVIPADDTHLHYGKAQTETKINLSPGKHTLTLQFADGAHRSYGGQFSKTITVNVK